VSIVTGNGLKDTASARTAAGVGGGVTPNGHGESKLLNIEPDIDLLVRELAKRGIC
jgi:hypothetical protein